MSYQLQATIDDWDIEASGDDWSDLCRNYASACRRMASNFEASRQKLVDEAARIERLLPPEPIAPTLPPTVPPTVPPSDRLPLSGPIGGQDGPD